MPAGRLAYGTAFSFGATDFLQFGTDVVRDAYGILNANAKVALVATRPFAAAVTLDFEKFNFRDLSASNPDVDVTAWEPGLVAAVEVSPGFAWFVGGNLELSRQTTTLAGAEVSGLARGAAIASDLSWAYESAPGAGGGRPRGESRGIGNVMSAGITYDVTYRSFGAGLSHHWPGFQLGLHYYPDAATQKFLPIVVGGGSLDL